MVAPRKKNKGGIKSFKTLVQRVGQNGGGGNLRRKGKRGVYPAQSNEVSERKGHEVEHKKGVLGPPGTT